MGAGVFRGEGGGKDLSIHKLRESTSFTLDARKLEEKISRNSEKHQPHPN